MSRIDGITHNSDRWNQWTIMTTTHMKKGEVRRPRNQNDRDENDQRKVTATRRSRNQSPPSDLELLQVPIDEEPGIAFSRVAPAGCHIPVPDGPAEEM